MDQQRRAFLNVPDYHKTKQNDREFYVLDDPQFEPENADFLIGYIGDPSLLTEEDLERTPLILEDNEERQVYQLSIGTTFIDPASQERVTGAYYTDLRGQISVNGGLVEEPNRVFSTNYYAWTPPIDYDKHINFNRYFWVAEGAGDVSGEFIIKEPQGSKTTIYPYDGTDVTKNDVKIFETLPATADTGTYAELASVVDRSIFQFNGTSWVLQEFIPVDDIPTDFSGFSAGDTFYVARTGPDFNRPLVWLYSQEARRWIAQQVIVSITEPDTPRENMVWEDLFVPRTRRLKIYRDGVWVNLDYTTQAGPSGTGNDEDYIYDSRDYNDIDDEWSSNNWWRHDEDLSVTDRSRVLSEDQATRPILEFWAGIEQDGFVDRDNDGLRDRNDPPLYKKYIFDNTTGQFEDTTEVTTIFEYVEGTGESDSVLGFPTEHDSSGEILFDLTLESDESEFTGYKYFLDTITGFAYPVWHKSDVRLEQEEVTDDVYETPRSLTSNPDHQILTESSRSNYLLHMSSVIEAQEDFSGDRFGPNSYRWSKKSPARGSTIIDSEQTLLRALALLQDPSIGGMPQVIRRMGSEYNKVLFRFTNKMNQKWNNLDLSDPAGTLIVNVEQAVDSILTELFIGRNDEFPYFYSDMGTYQETRITSGDVQIIDSTRQPIYIPPSPPRVGPSPCYVPSSFEDRDGVTRLRGHEGYTVTSFGDDRDLIWLNLQNRFFEAVPQFYKTETEEFSSRFAPSNFWLDDYFGDYEPNTTSNPVDNVVEDYRDIVSPTQNQRVFSTDQAEFANYDGNVWLTRNAVTDETIFNLEDEEYYFYNGKGTHKILSWNRDFDWDYSDNEFRQILRREFERFILFREDDFSENTEFDIDNPFTWNYSSAGVEGHYRGIYRRVYNTIRPHSHSWEVVGYKIEPTWWRTEYVPSSTASDGTPRYANDHPMWDDFKNGVVNPIDGTVRDDLAMIGPTPVDEDGELLDPIAAGVVEEDTLDTERLDDVWTYGDGYDTEQEFINSAFYPYSFSLQGYLMKNGVWTDTVWSEVYISIGEKSDIKLGTGPHVIHRDTLTRPAIGDLPVHLQRDEEGNVAQRLGVNAWVSEFIQIIGASPTFDFARVIQNTTTALSWKTSGFIRDNRTIVATLSGDEIPFDDVHNILHASQPIDEQFCSGMVIIREDPVGYRVFGYDSVRPFFRVELPAFPIRGGQTEERESFTAEEGKFVYETENLVLPFNVEDNDTAKLAIIINGQRIKSQHINVLTSNTFELENKLELQDGDEITATVVTTPSNPSTRVRQFRVRGVNIPYTNKGNGQIVDVEYGRFFETSSEVVNFMLGYGRVLESEGWVFEDQDDTTGQQIDWLFGAKRFATWVLDNESVWNPIQNRRSAFDEQDRFEFSPIFRKAKYVIPFGQNFNVESLQNGVYGILNVNSEPIPSDETFSARVADTLEVEVNEDSQDSQEMYGLRVNVSEVQHVVFFSNVTRFNDLIYDPVTALYHRTLRVDSYRTNDWNGRLEAPGYLVDGGNLIPNFEKNAFDFTRFYDRIRTLDDPLKRDQGRNLYGWYPSDEYMDPIGAADRSRFDYYRGMIHAKGTIRPVIAYSRGTRLGRDNVFVYEDWAWKVAEYGDIRRQKTQFNIDKNELRDEATVICFGCEEDDFNNTLEVQDFNRTNTVIGSEPVDEGDPPPTFAAGQDFSIEVNEKSATIVLVTGGSLSDTVDEINSLLVSANIVEVETFVSNRSMAFRNTLDYTTLAYTLIEGTSNDLLITAGIEPGTYDVDNERWIIPPEVGQDGISNIVFPTDSSGLPDVENNDFFAKTFDTDPIETVSVHTHFDPDVGKFEPVAISLIDLSEPRDPARYNRGPETGRSNNLVWGEDQVGRLWWNTERAIYANYREPISLDEPDYEASAKVWGRLSFFRSEITREDEVATVQTLNPFTLEPVEHGLNTGDTVDIIDAEPEDWNVEDQEITLAPVAVTGTIEFQSDNALGDVEVPSTVSTTGNTVYDERNTVTGTTEFETTNYIEGVTGDVDFRVGDAIKVVLPSRTITLDFQTFTGGTAAQFASELNDSFNSNGIFEIEAFSNFVQFVGGQVLGFRNRLNREGIPFEFSHIQSSHTGSDTNPSFAVGDEVTVQTDTDTRTIFLDLTYSGANLAEQVANEINDKLYDWVTYTPSAGQLQMPEVEAFESAGALGFRTRDDGAVGDQSCEIYTLGPGLQGPDLLVKAGIDSGQYGSILSKAGIKKLDGNDILCGETARYDEATIVGIDEVGAGSAPSFSLFTDTDLLKTVGITPTTSNTSVTGTEDLSSPIERTILAGSSFITDVQKTLEPTYTTTQTTLNGLITEFNNALVADNLTDFEVYSNGNRLAIRLTDLAADNARIEVPTAGYTGSIWDVAGLDPDTYDKDNIDDAVGSVVNPTFSGESADTNIKVSVVFELSENGDIDELVDEINDSYTDSNVNDSVAASNDAGSLKIENLGGTGDEFTLIRLRGIEFENPESTGIVGVVSSINLELENAGVFDVEAFFDEFRLGIRNTAEQEGKPFELLYDSSVSTEDLLDIAGIPEDTYDIIPVDYSFSLETRSGFLPVDPYTTVFSGGLDAIVEDINKWINDEAVAAGKDVEVQAINSDQRLSFQNTSGFEGKGFKLIRGDAASICPPTCPYTDLLGTDDGGADFKFVETPPLSGESAFFEIISANAGFDISTSSGKLQFNSEGGNLDFVITEINNALPFAKTEGTVDNPTYAVGDDFTITVFSNVTKTLNFSSTAGGDVTALVAEINAAFLAVSPSPIVEVEAFEINDSASNEYLGFRNSVGIPEIAFLLTEGTTNDILATSGIEARLYGGIVEVSATRDGNFLNIINNPGRDSEYFTLAAPTNPLSTTDLLNTTGLDATSYGQYEAESSFTITLNNGKGLTYTTPDGGTLSKIIEEINTDFQNANIIEVIAVDSDNRLRFENTEDDSGVNYNLSPSTTGPDLLSATGLLPGEVNSGTIDSNDIVGVTTGGAGAGEFQVDGDQREKYGVGSDFRVTESTGNDGTYTVQSRTYDSNTDITSITPDQAVSDATVDGFLTDGLGYTYITDPTKFTYQVQTEPDSPAQGDPKVITGFIDLYEWVRSPVPPEDWVDYTNTLTAPDHPTGTPLNEDDPSYVELIRTNTTTGRDESTYYFWVIDNTGTNQHKPLTTSVVADRLESPTAQAIQWFAPMDSDHMLIFQGTTRVEDDYAIEVFIDARDLETHIEWTLVSENDQFNSVPDEIVDKMIDSLSEVDEKGNTCPSPLLNDFEKFGSSFFPIQTVFSSVEDAVDVYVESLNGILARKDLSRFDPLVSIFQLSDEFSDSNPDGFWQRSKYIQEEYEDTDIFDTVVTEAERDRRGDAGFYIDGDLVDVLQSGNLDPWLGGPYSILSASTSQQSFTVAEDQSDKFREGERFVVEFSDNNDGAYTVSASNSTFDGTNTEIFVDQPVVDSGDDGNLVPRVTSTYVFQDESFIEVGVENHTVSINSNIRTSSSKFRSTYYRTYEVLERVEQNELIFALLYEMMRQHLNADWFIKTSFISTQIFDTISRSPFVRPSEPQAILDNINDVKPFRTKYRTQSETWSVEEVEEVPTEIIEFPDIKTTLIYDRLSCDDTEDGGWDGDYWDSEDPPTVGWDRPFWEFDDLGRQEWVDVGTIEGGTVQLSWDFFPDYTPSLYGHQVIFLEGDTAIDFESLGFEVTIETTSTKLTVSLNTLLPINFTILVQQAQGLLEGDDPALPDALLEKGFQTTESTYEHHIPRVIRQGSVDRTNPQEGIIGCDSEEDTGGSPEERVETEVIPSVNICIINTWEESLGSWDGAPWDTTGWDSPPMDVGDRIFIIAVGEQEENTETTEVFPTDELYQNGDDGFQPPYIIGTYEDYTRVLVEVQPNGTGDFVEVTEGVEYEVVEPFNNIIEFGSPEQQDFTADGSTTLFGPISSPTGVQTVKLNRVTLTEGLDYLITTIGSDDFVDFTPIQPDPRIVTENFLQEASWTEGDNVNVDFEVNVPQDSLAKDNVFVFKDGVLEPQGNYNVATTADVEMLTAPLVGEFISVVALGNFRADNQDLTVVQNFDGNSSDTIYTVGNNARVENTFVFVDGLYQTFGGSNDYTFIAPGTSSAQIVFNVAPPSGTDNIEVRIVRSPLGDTLPYINMEHVIFTASGGPTDEVPGLFDIDIPNRLMVFVNGVLKNGYSSLISPDYIIQSNLPNPDRIAWKSGSEPNPGDAVTVRFTRDIIVTETVIQDVVPVAGDLVEIIAVPYLENDDVVRYRYNGWPVGRLGPFEVVDFPDEGLQTFSGDGVTNIFLVGNDATTQNTFVTVDGDFQRVGANEDYTYSGEGTSSAQIIFNTAPPSGTDNIVVRTDLGFDAYTIEDGTLTLPDEIPDVGLTVTVEYKQSRDGDLKRSILVRMSLIAVDILEDHTLYDPPNGFEENRRDGVIYVNTTDATYYQWNEGTSSWDVYGTATAGDEFYVRRKLQIWGYDGSSFNKLFDVGDDTFTTPPVLEYPEYGTGLMFGTYSMGQTVDAENDFPEAYEVMQHPGDCGSGT